MLISIIKLSFTYVGAYNIISYVCFFLSLGFIEVAFTNSMYIIPNAPENSSCARDEHSLPLPPAVQLQLNKPAPVAITVNVTVKGEDTKCRLCPCIVSLNSITF